MKDRILQTLSDLRDYARGKGHDVAIHYHEEDSYLMRFANSAISLNTNEHLIRLDITAYAGRKRASYSMITNLDQLGEMKTGVDTAAEMVTHSQPLTYEPTVPVYHETFVDDSHFDPSLARLSNEERLAYFNSVAAGLEGDELVLSGIFSCGSNTIAMTNTRSDHIQFFQTSDAQITTVLAHRKLKWEVSAEQSAHNHASLDPEAVRAELDFLVERYQSEKAGQLPIGSYQIAFGPAATAELLSMMKWIGFDGGLMKRGYSFLTEEQVGTHVLSDRFTLTDDPFRPETFPFRRDFTGIDRRPYPIFSSGVFQGFLWSQDDADEFEAQPTGHTVAHTSLVLDGGDQDVSTIRALAASARDTDVLYIPFLHYMNIVNPSKGIITASSRFGALLLKQDGSVEIPYNVRMTVSLLDVFGDRVAWLSRESVPYNTSQSYGARNPTAIIVPKFVQVNDMPISHSNISY